MTMGKDKNQNFEDHHHHQRWTVMKESNEHEQHPCSSIEEASTISDLSSSSLTCSSSSSLDTMDDASSANSSRSSLYDLSDLMSHLPIKRGLSKFYHGKSDSFTSLARVTSIEDIPKKSHKKMKKSYGPYTSPKPIISKKSYRKKFNSSIKNKLNE
ncbi:hypothetical protein L1987_45244 [Smallanthus sonchifolius]|uniref:Uncharacterized protein n=1 Tax=Smallanthus sonchifolius TaxID=185202 RepID=A0ACB9GSX2_9ASTR|nr:hypothetical protein L1987_45244 [Smallanthus sonchifolius]